MNKCFLQLLALNSSLQRKSLKTLQKNMKPLRNTANRKGQQIEIVLKKLPFEEKSELGIFTVIMGMGPSDMLSYFSFMISY